MSRGAMALVPLALLAGIALLPGHSSFAEESPPVRSVADTLPVSASEPPVPPLGFGREPTDEEVADWNVTVLPDGTGLPSGSGTAEQGGPLYAARCAACHGPQGHGTPAGWPLVGRNPGDAFNFNLSLDHEMRRTVGNYWPYAPILFSYIRRSMPADRPGSLGDSEVYALTAWILWRNELIRADEVMDAATLPRVEMPARGQFVPDDRPGSRP
jgi:S-disulfanyl-L-cysteine oxidoreductase SoxD